MPSLPRIKGTDNYSQQARKINDSFAFIELLSASTLTTISPTSAQIMVIDDLSGSIVNKSIATHYSSATPFQITGEGVLTIPADNKVVKGINFSNSGAGYSSAPTLAFSDPYTVSVWNSGASYSINNIVFVIGGDSKKRFYKATTSISGGSEPTHASGITSNWLMIGRTAVATVTISAGGVNSSDITDNGFGYTAAPTITFTGGGFSTPAVATALMYSDIVFSLNNNSILNKPEIVSLTDNTRATDFLLVYDSSSLKKIKISTITPDVPTGSVLFGSPTDSYIWDSTNFHWDDTNNRLGLGTNTPDALLTVNGVGAFGDGSASVPSITNTGDLNTGFWFPAADTIAASTAGVERIRVLSTGEIGIGTSSPSVKLQVIGGRSSFAAASESFAIGARYVSTGGDVFFGATNGTPTPDVQISNAGGGALMTLLNGGNVGIGTASPSEKLHIVGSGATAIIISTSGASANPELRLTAVGRQFNVGVGGATFATTALQGSYYIYDATAAEYRFVIDASGRVGIGTTTPVTESTNARLALVGTGGQVASTLATSNSNAIASFRGWSSTGYSLAIGSVETTGHPYIQGVVFNGGAAAANLILQGFGGVVGIGTVSPDALLTVAGVGAFGDGSASTPSISNTGDLNTGFWFPAADTIAASTAGVERIRVISDGNVGIGTTSPLALRNLNLEIGPQGTNDGAAVIVNKKGSGVATLRLATQGAASGFDLNFNSPTTGYFGIYDIAATANRLVIDTTGNIGIGTTSPVVKLQVVGGRSSFAAASEPFAVGARFISTGGDVYFGATNGTATPDAQISSASGGALLTLFNNGNVSIGTITSGIWNGTVITGQYGGTGVANSGKFITLGGNLTTSGAFAVTLTATATTSVFLPTSGTLATLAGAETLTNKTIAAGSNTISGLVNANLSGTAGITNANLANSAVTIGSTSISLGASSTTLAGLTSVTSTTFTGAFTGNATTATTATSLATPRNFSLGGVGSDVTSPVVSFNGTGDVQLVATIISSSLPYLQYVKTITSSTASVIATSTLVSGTQASNVVISLDAPIAGAGLTFTSGIINVIGTTNRILVNADSIDISSSYVGQATITTLGTIASGTWNGAVIAGLYGGTGVANSGKTITLGGNLTTSGAFAVTLIASATTSVTLPTSGTLVNTAGTGAAGTWGINVTGSAATATTSTNATNLTGGGTISAASASISNRLTVSPGSSTSATIANITPSLGAIEVSNGGSTNAAFISFNRTSLYSGYFGLDSDNVFKIGGASFGSVSYVVLHSSNFNTYSPTLTGTGASGTWGINIGGIAASVTNGVYTTGTQTIGGAKTFSNNATFLGNVVIAEASHPGVLSIRNPEGIAQVDTLATSRSRAVTSIQTQFPSGWLLTTFMANNNPSMQVVDQTGTAAGNFNLMPFGGSVFIAGASHPGALSVLGGALQVTTLATSRSLAVTSIQTLNTSGWLLTTFMANNNPSMQVVDHIGTSAGNLNLMPFGGSVGIGSTVITSGAKLDVSGTITIRGTGTDPGFYSALFMNDAVAPYTTYLAGYTLGFNTGGNSARSTRMYIDNAGLVGIGTTSPSYKLDVGGFAAAAQTIRVASTGAISSVRLMEADDSYGFSLQNINGSRFGIFRHNASQAGAEVLSIDRASGNVGIGTSTPSYKLAVADSSAVSVNTLWLDNNFGTSSDLVESSIVLGGRGQSRAWGRIGGKQRASGSYGEGVMHFYTYSGDAAHSTPDMTIYSNGNVGIGTTDPQYKLDVNGTLRVTGAATFSSTVTATTFTGALAGNATTATNATTAASCSGNAASVTNGVYTIGDQTIGGTKTFSSTVTANITGSAYNITQYTINQNLGTANSPTFAGLTVNSTIAASINGNAATATTAASCSGNAASVTNGVYTIGDQTIGGTKTFSSTIVASITGNAATATTATNLSGFTINQNLGTANSPNFAFLGINAAANASYRLYVVGDVYASGDVYAGSDIRLKENITELSNALDKVKNLKGYSYNKIGVNHRSIGLMAQDVEKIIPEVVSRNTEGMKGIDYGQMIAMLVEAIKELNTKMETIHGATV